MSGSILGEPSFILQTSQFCYSKDATDRCLGCEPVQCLAATLSYLCTLKHRNTIGICENSLLRTKLRKFDLLCSTFLFSDFSLNDKISRTSKRQEWKENIISQLRAVFQTRHISSFCAQLQGIIIPKASTSWENSFLRGNGWSSDGNLSLYSSCEPRIFLMTG